ncbi:MAG: MaoC family dehydratase N-terminal domain-containing protein [Chloroflexi bacterium]|nr:MaoC family dehydratase N-terminal domain-containing protein [Chloroflexota bacterium]
MATEQSYIPESLRKAVGVESEAEVYEVERGAIIRFAEAIDDPNPVYQDEAAARRTRFGGTIAPPTFFRAMRAGPPRVQVESPFRRVLDGGSEWEFNEPVRPGDRISVTQRLSNVAQRAGRLGPMIILTRETRYVNQLGQLVAVQRSTSITY